MADLVLHRLVVEFHAEAGPGWHTNVTVLDLEGFFDVTVPETHLFLAEEIRNRGGQLQAACERDRPEWVVRRDRSVIGLGHTGDQPSFHNPARVTQVRLQNSGGLLLENLAKAPL